MKAILILTLTLGVAASAQEIPGGYWPESKSAEILRKTETIRLAPDLSSLSDAERAGLKDLYEVGAIMQRLYEISRHHQAVDSYDNLRILDVKLGQPAATQNLLSLYRLFQGPIATTLDNKRDAFLPVTAQLAGRNVYPIDATRDEIEAFLAANPSARAEILDERSVVRRTSRTAIGRDLQMLNLFPVLRELHPELLPRVRALDRDSGGTSFYAVPYSLAYAEDLINAYRLLLRAAGKLETSDAEFARYLRNRARDLLSNDYESGDASWVTGRFKRFNAQIGAYETYDDSLYGVKAFHGMSIMLENQAATAELRRALKGLQDVEDALPYENDKRVRDDIPVGVYDVIADFGQARGTNTATILPNDALFSRRYGRTIMLRQNIMTHPEIFASALRVWKAVTGEAHAADLAPEGNVQRTLWHEIGHYLGPDRDKQGRTLDVALEDYADAIEEMKSDLVSLFALQRMEHPSLRTIQAAGIHRTLQNVKPRRDQPYQTMQLIQFNWFVDKGLLIPKNGRLSIDYARYPEAVSTLLAEVLKLQQNGDKAAAAAFFDRWTRWDDVHEKLAGRIRDAQGARFRIVRYAALGE